jgi:hypothetical protein
VFPLVALMVAFSHAQAALVIPLVGTIRVSDLCLIVLLLLTLSSSNTIKQYHLPLFILFGFLPFYNLVTLHLTGWTTNHLDLRSAVDQSLRYHPLISIIQATLYGLMILALVTRVRLNDPQILKLNKIFIYFGALVAIYAHYGMFGVAQMGLPDIIPDLVDRRNSQPEDFPWRMMGLSNEPGTYAYLTSLTLLSLLHTDVVFGLKKKIIFVILASATIFSMSAPALVFWLIYIICSLTSFARISIFVISVSMLYLIIKEIFTVSDETLWYLSFYTFGRIQEFLLALITGASTYDYSGGQRAATFLYGITIAEHTNFLGTGPGMSIYAYEAVRDDIIIHSSVLQRFIFPQNIYTFTLAEYGLIGLASLLFFIFGYYFARQRNQAHARWTVVAFSIFGLAIAPIYATFLFIPFLLVTT